MIGRDTVKLHVEVQVHMLYIAGQQAIENNAKEVCFILERWHSLVVETGVEVTLTKLIGFYFDMKLSNFDMKLRLTSCLLCCLHENLHVYIYIYLILHPINFNIFKVMLKLLQDSLVNH